MKLVVASGTFGKHAPNVIKSLRKRFELKSVKLSNAMSDEEIAEALSGADAVLLGASGRITRKIIGLVPTLKLIAKHGVGLDNIDLEVATEHKIPIVYCRHTMQEISVAEHTMALLLAAARHVAKGNEYVKSGKWKERSKLIGCELYGKTLGIIGLGAIGRRVAQIAKRGFEMNVVAYDPYVPDKVFRELGVKSEGLNALLQTSDVITIHVPLTKETRNLIDAERLEKIKRGAIVINTSRGAVVDEEALAEKVKEGRIKAAALDVMRLEPPELDNPLLKMEEVIITPHVAMYTTEALTRMDNALAEDILRFFNGERPLRVANPEVFNP